MKLSSLPNLDNLPANKKGSAKLWILRLHPDNEWVNTYDTAQGFVVRAPSSKKARLIAAAHCGDESNWAWLNPFASSCTELTTKGEPEVILRDYRAG